MWLEIAAPANRAVQVNGIAMRGSRLTGLRFFHVIANLIFGVFFRRAGISATRASPPNRVSPAYVIGPLGGDNMEKSQPGYPRSPHYDAGMLANRAEIFPRNCVHRGSPVSRARRFLTTLLHFREKWPTE